MRVLVLGASGGVGKYLVGLAAAAGHDVTCLSRAPMEVPAGVKLVVDDLSRPGCLDALVEGQDAVLSALGLKRVSPNPFSALSSPPDLTSATARLLVTAMKAHGVRQVIAVSASGVGDSAPGLNLMMRFMIAATTIGRMYADLELMEQVYAASGLDWCCARPTGLSDGEPTRQVKVIPNFPLTARIRRSDVAWWMVEQLGKDHGALRTPTLTGA